MARVELERVEKVYAAGARALADVTLDVADGELLVVVGPSGCGKSTLLRLVAGLEEATAGTIRIGDRVVNDLPPQARNVAMVFQDYALYPYLSVRGNLEFPLKMRRWTRTRMHERVEAVAGVLGLAPLLDRLPKQLSGGQRQRVAMGRALVREPTAFLLDEPLSNLDARLRVQVRADIKDLQTRTATTMLYVTHDQTEAMTLGDRVAVLDQGQLQQVSTPRDLYDHPANAFVAGFIGSPPMNLFTTRLASDAGGGIALRLGGQALPISSPHVSAERLRGRLGSTVTAGIRPEAVRLGEGPVRATVEHLESLGHETLAHLAVDADGEEPVRLVARVPGMPSVTKGAALSLRLDPAAMYLFDETGRSLADRA